MNRYVITDISMFVDEEEKGHQVTKKDFIDSLEFQLETVFEYDYEDETEFIEFVEELTKDLIATGYVECNGLAFEIEVE